MKSSAIMEIIIAPFKRTVLDENNSYKFFNIKNIYIQSIGHHPLQPKPSKRWNT